MIKICTDHEDKVSNFPECQNEMSNISLENCFENIKHKTLVKYVLKGVFS